MKYYLEYARKVFLIISALIVGVLIFVSSSSLHISHNIFNPSFHEKLFVKHDIYSGVSYILDNSITKFIAYIKKVSPDSYEQQKDVFDMLEQTTSKEQVTRSIDYLREGIYEYLSDQRKFLPDITLKDTGNNTSSKVQSGNSFLNISKVNLQAVLTYANRSDIVDYLSFIKLIYYFVNKLPNLALPLLLMLFVISFGLLKNFRELYKYLYRVFIVTASLFGLITLSLFIYVYLVLPRSIQHITMTLSMDSKPLLAYIKDCVNPFIFFGLSIALVSGALVFVLVKLVKKAESIPNDNRQQDYDITDTQIKVYNIIKYSILGFIVVLLISSFYVKAGVIVKDYKENDFASVIYKMRGVETVSQVIPAQDDFVHDVLVKVVDGKTNEPVKDVKINISGKNEDNGKEYVDTKTLDENGQAKFNLDKGFFRLMFYTPSFPTDKYKLPGSVFFELTNPGTKVLTINLEPVPVIQSKSGFAEIEVLDADNKALEGIELEISSGVNASGHPDYVTAVSNSQGTAVFKLNEGEYTVKFNSSKLPAKYSLPQDFSISVKPEKTSRYTIKMIKN